MEKLKSIAVSVSIMLLIAAPLCLYFSLRNLSELRSPSEYEDAGVYSFFPEEVAPILVENHATGRARRTQSTRTVYRVTYLAEDGYRYREEYSVETLAQAILEEGRPVQRRVLLIPQEDAYTTIDPDQTVESYLFGQKRTYYLIAGACSLYLLGWGAAAALRRRKRQNREQWDF